jgi:hypothetical protein
MSSFEGLNNFFNGELINIANNLAYSKVNLLILNGKEEEIKIKYPETYQNILSCRYHADNRNVMDYAKDIVSSWVFEDYFISNIFEHNLKLELDGADKNREILPNKKTSSNSDYLITFNKIQRTMELMSDYKGYWSKYKKLDLRDSKYKKLVTTKSIFIGVCIPDHYFLFIDFASPPPAKFIPSHFPYGRKPAYQINITSESKTEFNFENIVKKIKSTYL